MACKVHSSSTLGKAFPLPSRDDGGRCGRPSVGKLVRLREDEVCEGHKEAFLAELAAEHPDITFVQEQFEIFED